VSIYPESLHKKPSGLFHGGNFLKVSIICGGGEVMMMMLSGEMREPKRFPVLSTHSLVSSVSILSGQRRITPTPNFSRFFFLFHHTSSSSLQSFCPFQNLQNDSAHSLINEN